jgi:hypothetical protein
MIQQLLTGVGYGVVSCGLCHSGGIAAFFLFSAVTKTFLLAAEGPQKKLQARRLPLQCSFFVTHAEEQKKRGKLHRLIESAPAAGMVFFCRAG